MRGLKGRRAVIAGGAGGIGAAICRRLGEEGMHVICADISERRGAALAGELSGAGLSVSFAHLDAGDPASWDRVAASAPRIDALVTAAYFARGGPIQALSNEEWTENFRVTLDGVFFGMRACLPRMQRGAAIVNISSVAALLGMPVNPGYGAAKGAVSALSRVAAVSFAPQGIRVNSISPGFIATRALDGLGELMATELGDADAAKQSLRARIPLGGFGAPADIAGAVAFLLSDDASYITGVDLLVDGGYMVA
jgi:NAD(P)-dependent dehydrogenase (short-subunit alcohol dehydrogenase family)